MWIIVYWPFTHCLLSHRLLSVFSGLSTLFLSTLTLIFDQMLHMDVAGKSGDLVAATHGRLLCKHYQWLVDLEKCHASCHHAPTKPFEHAHSSIVAPTSMTASQPNAKDFSYKLCCTSPVRVAADFIMLIAGKVLQWAKAVWEAQDKTLLSFLFLLRTLPQRFWTLSWEGKSQWIATHDIPGEIQSRRLCIGVPHTNCGEQVGWKRKKKKILLLW